MPCATCGYQNPVNAERCADCGALLAGFRPPTLGQVLADRYEILGSLGAGGMGRVYEARDRKLDETVALKVVRPRDAAAAARFRAEVKLAWKVRHRNVCGIHEYGEDGELLFITMERVHGHDLKQLLRERGPLPWVTAYDLAIQAAEGLRAIHEAGVIHRDLKPANLMLDDRGCVRVMDFGIARTWEEPDQAQLTASGYIVGTPDYMSPEQIRGLRLDYRSDLYALAVLTCELFTGRTPFRGDTPMATMLRHLEEQPSLDAPVPLPAALVPVLNRALAKDPAQRYVDAASMGQALRGARDALASESTGAVTPTPALIERPSEAVQRIAESATESEAHRPVPPPASAPIVPAEARLLVPILLKGLRHQHERVRAEAARALGQLGPLAGEAASDLDRVAQQDDSQQVRGRATDALRALSTPVPDSEKGLGGVAERSRPGDVAASPREPSGAQAESAGPPARAAPARAWCVRRTLTLALVLLTLVALALLALSVGRLG